MSTDELLQALLDMDPEFRDELVETLEENPEALRRCLQEIGSKEDLSGNPGTEKDWTVISDERSEEEDISVPDPELTPAEKALYSVVETMNTPRTADEVRELVVSEREDLVERFNSLDNRGWISNKLNQFAKDGLVGKYRDGREVRYTPDITVAVRNWARKNEVFEADLAPAVHTDRIIADTNMNRNAIQLALKDLQE